MRIGLNQLSKIRSLLMAIEKSMELNPTAAVIAKMTDEELLATWAEVRQRQAELEAELNDVRH